MAPEIEQGLYSATIDVFAFGIVLLDACGVKLTKPLRLHPPSPRPWQNAAVTNILTNGSTSLLMLFISV